ncbi:MAG TPA: Glu/Leu/Phe/Val dehydrogenase dimerization domain-containing protein [Flavobacteriales bacterium]|nr:Glu/Leu/Phe/Val dehydrogenase dimerization domain-containing protein [Flavobacteriales bacterium]
MKDLLKQYENRRPVIIFEWQDTESEAEGWIVINSLRGNAAGGGTRMRKGLDRREVESLAKTMEIKFTVSGPEIGGAKSGINFDPADPRKKDVLRRWYKAVMPLLKNYYGTGGDLNVDEIHEVIPITEEYGLWHPQEGVVNGHYGGTEGEKIKRIGQLRSGVSKVLENLNYTPDPARKLVVADMITGFGVSESVRHFYNIYNESVKGKRVIIQGWGNVASAAAYYLSKNGALIVGIIDRSGGIIKREGLTFEEVTDLFLSKNGNTLQSSAMQSFEEINAQIWDVSAEVFIPAAASRLVSREQVVRMKAAGMQVISSGANVPFADPEIFFGPTMEYADEQIAVIPDFISNCGMARVFAYLMKNNAEISDSAIFEDSSEIIRNAMEKVAPHCPNKVHFSREAYRIALQQLV